MMMVAINHVSTVVKKVISQRIVRKEKPVSTVIKKVIKQRIVLNLLNQKVKEALAIRIEVVLLINVK